MTNATVVHGGGERMAPKPRDPAVAADGPPLDFAPLLLQLMGPPAPAAPSHALRSDTPADKAAPASAGAKEARTSEMRGPVPAAAARRSSPNVRLGSINLAHAAAAELRTAGEVRLDTRQALERRVSDRPVTGDHIDQDGARPEPGAEPRPRRGGAAMPAAPAAHAAERPHASRGPDPSPALAALHVPRAPLMASATAPPATPPASGAAREGSKPIAPAGGPSTTGGSPPSRAPVASTASRSTAAPSPGPVAASVDRAAGSAARAPLRAGAAAAPPRAHAQTEPVEQVHKGLATVLRHRGGTVTIRLTPESLGPVRIRLDVGEGRVTAKFEAATDGARRLLEANLDGLRASLEARGLTVERLDIGALTGEPPSRTPEERAWDATGGAGEDEAATGDSTRREAHGRAEERESASGSAPAEPAAADGPVCVVTHLGLDTVA